MKKTSAAIAALIASTITASATDRDKRVDLFAATELYVNIAALQCPSLNSVARNLALFRVAMELTDEENAYITGKTQLIIGNITDKIKDDGVIAWCKTAYERFGPKGTLLKGLLVKNKAN